MSIHRLASLLALASLCACVGQGSDQGSTFHFGFPHITLPFFSGGVSSGLLQKEAEAGKPVLLWGDTSLGDDCVPMGETQFKATAPPLHGTMVVKPGRLYAVYPEGDRHAACSGRLVTGVLAIYTAEKDFAGVDQVGLKAVTADGQVQLVTVNITVSAAPPKMAPQKRAPSEAPPAPPIAKPTIRDPDAPAPTVLRTPYPGG